MLAVVLLGELRSFCVESCRRRFVSKFAGAIFFCAGEHPHQRPALYHEQKNETLHRCTSEELDLVRRSVAWTVYRTIEDDGDDLPTDFRVNDFVFLPPHGQRLHAQIASMARHILDHESEVGAVFDTIVVVRPDLRVHRVPLVAGYSLLTLFTRCDEPNAHRLHHRGRAAQPVDVALHAKPPVGRRLRRRDGGHGAAVGRQRAPPPAGDGRRRAVARDDLEGLERAARRRVVGHEQGTRRVAHDEGL